MKKTKKIIGTIDASPSWENTLPDLLVLLDSDNQEKRDLAMRELNHMAKVADEYIKVVKVEWQIYYGFEMIPPGKYWICDGKTVEEAECNGLGWITGKCPIKPDFYTKIVAHKPEPCKPFKPTK